MKKRTEARKLSRISNGIWRSLQSCRLRDNLGVLESNVKSPTSKSNCQLFSHLQGLKAVLEVLLAQLPFRGRTTQLSFLDFEEAFSLFASYNLNSFQTNTHKKVMMKERDLESCFSIQNLGYVFI